MSDCLKTQKPLPGKGFRYLMLFLFIVDYRPLLPNTKLREYRSKNLINANLPSNTG